MYTGLSYGRYRQEEASERRRYDAASRRWNDGDAAAPAEAPARRTRYARSSTASVAQLLSESCTSLLQKLTTKVRGPSATVEANKRNNLNPLTTSRSAVNVSKSGAATLGGTRMRLEDKYSSVLEKIYGRRRDPERTIEPSVGRALSKSATSAVLAEKAYPYVAYNSCGVAAREKTPFRGETRAQHRRPEPPYAYLDGEAASRLRHRSNHSELRPRRSSKPLRTGKSEAGLKLCPVEMPPLDGGGPVPVHSRRADEETTPTPAVPDPLSEREAKRKEIQSLIMKYSALDEVYNRGASGAAAAAAPKQSAATVIARKYYPAAARLAAVLFKR
ncbi:hypothetical protein BDFB_003773 [Asbolus verrucosus]|uniref:Uncharacterized protein n=1 Tax=Asbolus verrucosus TaxID=1661398 RepID=A0A482VKK7_ASBVE|nr:hypothetical protein BDFB_003773 [Asbolus verrucosus]